METKITVEVIKDKSYDPNFVVRVSYNDGITQFKNEEILVSRKPPKVSIEYPDNLNNLLEKIDVKKLQIEIMRAIVEVLLNNSGKHL